MIKIIGIILFFLHYDAPVIEQSRNDQQRPDLARFSQALPGKSCKVFPRPSKFTFASHRNHYAYRYPAGMTR